MTDQLFSAPATLARLHAGPVGPHMDAFAGLLSERGYARPTIRQRLRLVADLSHWLESQGLEVDDLDEERIVEFLKGCPRNRDFVRHTRAILWVLLEYLRNARVIPAPRPKTDGSGFARLLQDYAQYVTRERGLTPGTLGTYLAPIRRFLGEFGSHPPLLSKLHADHVTKFVLRDAQAASPSRARVMVNALRSFLRFLHLHGDIGNDLAAAIPTVANGRSSTLSEPLKPEQVECLLKSCDQGNALGERDYAILLLLARLGLRAGEVACLNLEDLDWRAGELTVHGKGLRCDRLPILPNVGEALATYLRHGRPRCSSRRVFIAARAPHRGLARSTISAVVSRTLARAGLHPAHRGAHLLRHTLATEMLRQGTSLAEIGQILRHDSPCSTEIYAQVDLTTLRDLTQPWPGGGA